MGRTVKRAHLTLGLVIFLFSLSCSRGAREKPENVVLIVVDTLRPDHLGCYGYKSIQTPTIDGLAKEGIRFEQAIAHCPITLPSISSLLTSLTPDEHGVHYSEGYRLPGEVSTLAEVFSAEGFRTAAVIGAVVLDTVFGIHQGFQEYDSRFPNLFPLYQTALRPLQPIYQGTQRRAEDVTNSAVVWLEANKGERFFLLLHYFDPHLPYDPPPPFAPQVEVGKYEDIFTRQASYYDGEIAYTDHEIRRFLEKMQELGLKDRSLIVLTSDHGEGLGDKGEDTHGVFLYESTLRVPLILSGATGLPRGKVVTGTVRTIDIYPTILDIFDIEPTAGIRGKSLVPMIEGSPETEERPVYIETYANRFERGWSVLRGIRTNEWKYIQAPTPELYSLEDDPGEKQNLHGTRKDMASLLEEELRRMDAEAVKRERVPYQIPDETFTERVRNLGYIGAGEPAFDDTIRDVSGPDPKEMFPAFRRERYIQESTQLALLFMASGQLTGARFFLDKVIKLDPENPRSRYYLAEIFRLQGLNDRGLDEIEGVLKLEPKNADAHYLKGLLASQAGKAETAISSFEKAIALKPDHVQAYNNLGMIHGQRGDYEKASAMVEKALEIDPDLAQAHANMGNVLSATGRPDRALSEWELALKLDPSMKNLHIFLGNTYYQQKELAKALDHYESFLTTNPDSFTVKRVRGWMDTIRGEMAKAPSPAQD